MRTVRRKKKQDKKLNTTEKGMTENNKTRRNFNLTSVIFRAKHHKKKEIHWFLNGISRDDFDTRVMFFQYFQ